MATSPPLENLIVPARESFGRFVVICTVVTTLAGGLVGYAHSSAGRAADRAASEADRLTVRASAARVRRLQLGYAVYDRFALAQEQLAQLASLTERDLGISGAKRGEAFETKIANLRRVAGDTRRSAAALAQRYDLPDITGAGSFGARGDPYFPSRFLRTAERQGVELAALRDAADEESSGWGSDAGAYLAVLTLFAVALYLFGFSLVQHARLPRVFVGAGLVLLATGVTWAAASYATKPQRAPPAAAAAFAAGHVALRNAYQPHEYRRAAAHFTRAIRLRPSFARAYLERGTAHYLAGSPQAAGPASITTAEAHERSIQDMLKAQELGLYTPELLTSLGFSRLVVGLEQRDDDLLERSVVLAREAVDAAVERRQDTDAIPHYNLAVALLAAGRLDDAQAAYATAVQKTSSEILTRQQTVAGALTDIQLVVDNTSGRVAAAARRLKGFVVASALKDEYTGDSERTPVDVQVRSTPGGLQLRNRGGSYPPLCNRDLVAVWYRTPGPGLGSYVPAESLTDSFRQCIQDLGYAVAESHLGASFPAECLPDGSYRLELYDGSNVVAERRVRTRWRSAAIHARDIGVRLCRPDGWTTWRGSQPSLDTAVISPDGERGIVVVRLSGSVAHRDHARVLATLLQRYRRLVGATADGGTSAHLPFMDIPRATTRKYVAGGKRILGGIGSDTDGSTVAAFVFGPRRWFGGTTPNALFDSLVLDYQPI